MSNENNNRDTFFMPPEVVFILIIIMALVVLPLIVATSVKDKDNQTQEAQVTSTTSTVNNVIDETTAQNTTNTVQVYDFDLDYQGNEVYSPSYYNGKAYIEINDNKPYFTVDDITTCEFETYSELDSLGRCGVAFANISDYTMPDEERGDISKVKPSGWHNVKYDSDIVPGGYVYNRCHLIGYQLAGENDNDKNLITGTRYLNIDGMLEHENEIAAYVKETGNHVLYRVTPIYDGDNLVADGVLMEAYSVEDYGKGIQFNIYAYNVQPGIEINYSDGTNWLLEGEEVQVEFQTTE